MGGTLKSISGWWLTYPSEKSWSEFVRLDHPNENGEVIKFHGSKAPTRFKSSSGILTSQETQETRDWRDWHPQYRRTSVHAIKDAPDEGTWQWRQPGADVMGCEIRKSPTGWLKTYTKWHVYHQLVQDFATSMKPCLKCFWSFQNKSQLVTSSLIRMWPCLVNFGLGWIGELLGETSTIRLLPLTQARLSQQWKFPFYAMDFPFKTSILIGDFPACHVWWQRVFP